MISLSRHVRVALGISLLLNGVLLLLVSFYAKSGLYEPPVVYRTAVKYVVTNSTDYLPAERPYIFVGGVPRSGTTLTRVLLDSHPDIRCGEETRIIPRILQMRERWKKSDKEGRRLVEAGLDDDVLTVIIRNFVSDVIELHGPPAKFLCNKDPLTLGSMVELEKMFPRAKFVLLIRDGRAVAHSIVSHNVTITGVDYRSHVSAALFWNRVTEKMWKLCGDAGPNKCLPVFYEKLVVNPRQEMEKLLAFLNIPWHDNVLRHQELVASNAVSLSK